MYATYEPPKVVSASAGRLRLRVCGVDASTLDRLTARLRALSGVTAATANPLTQSVLVQHDALTLSSSAIVNAAGRIQRELLGVTAAAIPSDRVAGDPRPPKRRLPPMKLVAGGAQLLGIAIAVAAAESPLHLTLAALDAVKLVTSVGEL